MTTLNVLGTEDIAMNISDKYPCPLYGAYISQFHIQ